MSKMIFTHDETPTFNIGKYAGRHHTTGIQITSLSKIKVVKEVKEKHGFYYIQIEIGDSVG